MASQGVVTGVCVNHPRRETALRCGKCGRYICTKCMVQTPVGVRCTSCAQLRRLPQFDVGPVLLLQAGFAGLAISVVGWLGLSFVPYLRYFLAILVGVAVGEAMSRLARRRVSRILEVTAVAVVLVGLVATEAIRFGSFVSDLAGSPALLVSLAVPGAIASVVAIVKLR